jgi:hypothetical protein
VRIRTAVALVAIVGGCGSAQHDSDDSDDAIVDTSPAATTTGTPGPMGTTSGGTGEGSDDDSSPFPVRFDLGPLPDAPAIDDIGCRGIDFLFVVDNSGSMGSNQQKFLNSFDGFIAGIRDSLDKIDSYHVGVITSDAYTNNEPGCTGLGDLVTQSSNGFGTPPMQCGPFAEGYRFATDADDLEAKFPCMATVGTYGSPIEQPVTGLIAALDPAKAEPTACNEAFVREDAILVVVIVTDDPPYTFDMDDAHPETDTTTWYDAVLAAKGGDPESVVVIGFIPWNEVTCAGEESPNLISFIESFGAQGILASVCEPDYSPIFNATLETIRVTCENFDPEG